MRVIKYIAGTQYGQHQGGGTVVGERSTDAPEYAQYGVESVEAPVYVEVVGDVVCLFEQDVIE